MTNQRTVFAARVTLISGVSIFAAFEYGLAYPVVGLMGFVVLSLLLDAWDDIR